jgi:hypothetical protein
MMKEPSDQFMNQGNVNMFIVLKLNKMAINTRAAPCLVSLIAKMSSLLPLFRNIDLITVLLDKLYFDSWLFADCRKDSRKVLFLQHGVFDSSLG